MPIDYKDYPENWKWLSRQVITDAKNRCELCFAPNGEIVCRDSTDIESNEYPWRYPSEVDVADECRTTKIVLTVHHIDGDTSNNSRLNLLALCQRCHLKLDIGKHVNNRRKNKDNNQQRLIL